MSKDLASDIVIQRMGSEDSAPRRLFLLFHGVGARAEDLVPLGQVISEHCPQSWIVSVRAPDASSFGHGWQWFSVQGVTEANRPARIAEAMPRFTDTVRAWQDATNTDPDTTTLIGFSQGAIMSLESTQESVPIANRVIAIAGRFAQSPRVAPPLLTLHLLHGDQDAVIAASYAREAADTWRKLGGNVTLDVFSGLGHGIDVRVAQSITKLLGKH